jgi:hypothetical protein
MDICVKINDDDAICPNAKRCPEAKECRHSVAHDHRDDCMIECPEIFPEEEKES